MKDLKDRVARVYQKFLVKKTKWGRYYKLGEATNNLLLISGGYSFSRRSDIDARINSMGGNSDPTNKADLHTLLALYSLKNMPLDLARENFRKAAKSYREGALGSRREDYLNASKEAMRNAKAVSYELAKKK